LQYTGEPLAAARRQDATGLLLAGAAWPCRGGPARGDGRVVAPAIDIAAASVISAPGSGVQFCRCAGAPERTLFPERGE
jgi:hypothetical protein